jgi:hypothetical protein
LTISLLPESSALPLAAISSCVSWSAVFIVFCRCLSLFTLLLLFLERDGDDDDAQS